MQSVGAVAIGAAITALLLAAGCSSGSSGDKPGPPPSSTSTTAKPFAGGINGPVSPDTSGPLGH
ncbi:MAG TPA: hypothetical protein VGF22_23965 [Acidimicrobiales bacterium]